MAPTSAPPSPRPAAPALHPPGPGRTGSGSGWPIEGGARRRPWIGPYSGPGPIRGRRAGPRPVSRTPRCSAVTSLPLPVVKATRALKINFKEPPSPGA